jgi:hypothetical protein
MDPKKLLHDLPVAIHDIIYADSARASWMTSDMNTHLTHALTEYSSAVAKESADPKDTAFWAALTHSRRREEDANQAASCEYYLGLNVSDRFAKRNFLTRLQRTFLGSTPRIDIERDLFLDTYGPRLLSGYEKYKDILHMKWDNPNYSYPEDRAERETIVLEQE